MKTLLFSLFCLSSIWVFGQDPVEIRVLESEAIDQFKNRLENISSSKRDSVFGEYDNTFEAIIIHPKFHEYLFDSLSKYVSIRSSPDGKLRSFSWDNLSGGSYHDYTTFLAYKEETGECSVVEIDTIQTTTSNRYVEVGFYQIEEIIEKNQVYYLLFGYGTYGGGKEHLSVRVFSSIRGIIGECYDCYENDQPIVIYRNRGQESNLEYKSNEKEISFRAYEFDEDSGFYKDKFEIVKMRFENGKFIQLE